MTTPQYPLNHIKGSKQGVFTMSKFLIGIVVFSLFVIILGGFYVAMVVAYDVPVSEKYEKSHKNIERMVNITTATGEQLQGADATLTTAASVSASSVFSVGQLMIASIKLPYDIISEFTNDLDIPIHPAFFTALTSILVIVITFGAFNLFARWFS